MVNVVQKKMSKRKVRMVDVVHKKRSQIRTKNDECCAKEEITDHD